MQLQKAERKRARIKMALQGPSGSGKTYSALFIAYGLCNDWNKIAVIDTENHSAELYAHLGEYNVVNIKAPFTPERYVEAIHLCESSGMEVIIIDSVSHEWEGSGGILDQHSNMTGNSYTNWAKLTPRHNDFIQCILQSSCHIIGTIRSKQDYVLVEKNGKMVPEKVGMKGVTRDGMDYEFTLVLELDIKHNAIASKDRTNLFMGKPDFKVTPDTGRIIRQWCSSPLLDSAVEESNITDRINACKSLKELLDLYNIQPGSLKEQHAFLFSQKKIQLNPPITSFQKPSQNGKFINASSQQASEQ
ncbi:AAA family ATPase [soil metagenome]